MTQNTCARRGKLVAVGRRRPWELLRLNPLLLRQHELIQMAYNVRRGALFPSLSLSSLSPSPKHSQGRKKWHFPKGEKMCVVDHVALERDLSFQRKALLRSPFKWTFVDFPSTEDPRNFPEAPSVITLIRNTEGNLSKFGTIWLGTKMFFQSSGLFRVSGVKEIVTILFWEGPGNAPPLFI